VLLCMAAALHVFVFSAAFPFFNVVDESAHFDLVVRYSHREIPRRAGPLDPEVIKYVRYYGTLEYLWAADTLPQQKFPAPPWTLPASAVTENLAAKAKIWPVFLDNYEASQPPLYYTVAAAWWHLGHFLHLTGGSLLYWLRFMNILAVIAIVWLAYLAARLVFPENSFIRLGVPALAAVLPQSSFYTLQNDIFSPLCFGAAFILIIKWARAEIPTVQLGAAAGLTIAATFLTKISNLPFLLVSAAFVSWHIWQLGRTGRLRPATRSITALIICAALPIALWLIHTKHSFGDFTGLQAKMPILSWTIKPFPAWWHHPIFTRQGAWTFISELLSGFWQGEMVWHRKQLGFPAANLAYVILSVVPLGAAAVTLSRPGISQAQKSALWFALAAVFAGIAFLGFLSLIFDFHYCVYPSRQKPYFTSGRLILGALIPFLLLCVLGIDCCLYRVGTVTKFASLGLLMIAMLAGELLRNWSIFQSAYNWFHL
jgi:hypothetical protein